jgi:hypothetical protein
MDRVSAVVLVVAACALIGASSFASSLSPNAATMSASSDEEPDIGRSFATESDHLPSCDRWPAGLNLREAMQDCSYQVELEPNERWFARTRIDVMHGRPVGVDFVSITRDCSACFAEYEYEYDREVRGRRTLRRLRECIREKVMAAEYPDARHCWHDIGWPFRHDW